MSVVALHPVTIRPARVDDLPEVLVCLREFFLESPWGVLKPDVDAEYIATWLLRLGPESRLLVAVEQEQMIGLCGGSIVDFPMIADLPYLWEWALWVRPEVRQTGIGNKLWGALIEWAKEHGAKGCARGKAEGITNTMMRQTTSWRWW